MSLFFVSDTHFGHRNLTQAGKNVNKPRPFADVDEHDETLIKRWNSVVKPQDTVYHLGDVFWRGNKDDKYAIMNRLNGKIQLILGNHDRDIRTRWGLGFETIQDLVTIKHLDRKIVLCHYPMLQWDSSAHGSIHLHGHCHGTMPDDPSRRRLDVGVDVWDYTPVSVDTVFAVIDAKIRKQHE